MTEEYWPVKIQRKPLYRMACITQQYLRGPPGTKNINYWVLFSYRNNKSGNVHFFTADRDSIKKEKVASKQEIIQEGIGTIRNYIEDLKKVNDPNKVKKTLDYLSNLKKSINDHKNDEYSTIKEEIQEISDYISCQIKWKESYHNRVKKTLDGLSDSEKLINDYDNCEGNDNKKANLLLSELLDEFIDILFRISIPIDWYENGMAYRLLQRSSTTQSICFYMRGKEGGGITKTRQVYLIYQESRPGNERSLEYKDMGVHRVIPDVDKDLIDFSISLKKGLFIPLLSLFNKDCPGKVYTPSSVFENENASSDYLDRDCIIIPIYEIYIHGEGYGGIQAFYCLYRCSVEEVKETGIIEHVRETLELIRLDIIDLSNDIFLSNIFRVKEKNIKKRENFIDYFLQIILYVQDWKTIWIKQRKAETNVSDANSSDIIYCWKKEKLEEEYYRWIDQFEIANDEEYYRWIDQFEIANDNDRESIIKALEKIEDDRIFKFDIKYISFLLKEEDKENNKWFLNHTIYFEYSEVALIPSASTRRGEIFNQKMRDRILQVMEVAIRMWYNHKENADLARIQGAAKQASHNLGHALNAIVASDFTQEIITQCPELTEEKKKDLESSLPDFVEKSDWPNPFLMSCRNVFLYIKERLTYLAELGSKQEKIDVISTNLGTISWEKFLNDFDFTSLLRKRLTSDAKKGKCYEIKFNEYNNVPTYIISLMFKQPFYSLLENYLRNVAKHNDVADGEVIEFYIRLKRDDSNETLDVSLWEKSKKNQCPNNFYQSCEELRKKHEEINRNPDTFKTQGLAMMHDAVNSFVFSKKNNLEVEPVYSIQQENNEEWRVLDDVENLGHNEGLYLSMRYKFKMDLWPQKRIFLLSNEFLEEFTDNNKINEIGYFKDGTFIWNIEYIDTLTELEIDGNLFCEYYLGLNEEDSSEYGDRLDSWESMRLKSIVRVDNLNAIEGILKDGP